MIFDDLEHNLKIELIDLTCKLSMLSSDSTLRKIYGILNFLERCAAVDGGDGLPFSYDFKGDYKQPYILITGDIIAAINSLHETNLLSESIQSRVTEELASIKHLHKPEQSFQL